MIAILDPWIGALALAVLVVCVAFALVRVAWLICKGMGDGDDGV